MLKPSIPLVSGITLGCDPELILVDRNTVKNVHAGIYFNKAGAIGSDGRLMELRPVHSTNPARLVLNLYDLIVRSRLLINRKRTKGIGPIMIAAVSSFRRSSREVLTAGFHLHYGLPKQLLGNQNRFIAYQMAKILDYYVGIPSIMPEENGDSYRRTWPGHDYGKPGTYRIGNTTFEYRVPGGSLMRHPTLACGIISLGAVVVEDIVSRIAYLAKGFNNFPEFLTNSNIKILYPGIPPSMAIFHTICSPTTDAARNMLPNIRMDVGRMLGFERRAAAINAYFDHIEQAKIRFSPDVEKNWRRYYNDEHRQQGTLEFLDTSV